jgi:hypothetical protein
MTTYTARSAPANRLSLSVIWTVHLPSLYPAAQLDDAEKAERLIRNLARRLEQVVHGVAASILEGLDEMPTAIRLCLPPSLRRSLACTSIIENMMGTIRRACRNVKQLARRLDGIVPDSCGDEGSCQGIPAIEGVQATSSAACRTRRSSHPTHRRAPA